MLAPLLLAATTPFSFVEKWSFDQPDLDNVAVSGSQVFYTLDAKGGSGRLGSLDGATGKPRWQRTIEGSPINLIATPQYLLVASENEILQLDPKTGRTIWQTSRAGYLAGPLIVGNRLIAETLAGCLLVVDLSTHQTIWNRPVQTVRTMNQNGEFLAAHGDALWYAGNDNQVARIALATGRITWQRPFDREHIERLTPMGDNLLVCTTKANVALRAKDGKILWTEKQILGENEIDVPQRKQIWSIVDDGNLYRIDTATGRRLGVTKLEEDRFRNLPIPYQGSWLASGRSLIFRLSPDGRRADRFDLQESVSSLSPLGNGLIVNGRDRIVRLAPGVPPLPTDGAVALLNQPKLSPQDRRVILLLGRPALPALYGTYARDKERRAELAGLLTSIVETRDTPEMLDLAKKVDLFTVGGEDWPFAMGDWLKKRGEPNLVAAQALPFLRTAKDERFKYHMIELALRATSRPATNELLARLNAPETSAMLKSLIYSSIAANGRPEVLDAILRIRGEGKRLAQPTPELSPIKDSDGDGLPDAFDANPLAAPRKLNETEEVLFAAFDALCRFSGNSPRIGLLNFGNDIRPFEVYGWPGAIIPENQASTFGLKQDYQASSFPYPALGFYGATAGSKTVDFDAHHTQATTNMNITFGPLGGAGYRIKLRKMRGNWFVVSVDQTMAS